VQQAQLGLASSKRREAQCRMEQPPALVEHAGDRTADTTDRQATPI